MGFEARLLESAPNAPHRPTQGGKNHEGEERKFPRDVEQTAEIDRNENGVLDQHLQTPHDRVLHLAHVAAHAGDDVAFALIAEEREGKRGDLVVERVANVAHNAGANGHHRGDRCEIARCFEECCRDKEDTDHQQRGRGTVVSHELRGIVVRIIDRNVGKGFAFRVPWHEMIDRLLRIKEEFEHGDERCERKDVEQRTQYVESQRGGNVFLVRADVAAKHNKEFLHRKWNEVCGALYIS